MPLFEFMLGRRGAVILFSALSSVKVMALSRLIFSLMFRSYNKADVGEGHKVFSYFENFTTAADNISLVLGWIGVENGKLTTFWCHSSLELLQHDPFSYYLRCRTILSRKRGRDGSSCLNQTGMHLCVWTRILNSTLESQAACKLWSSENLNV